MMNSIGKENDLKELEIQEVQDNRQDGKMYNSAQELGNERVENCEQKCEGFLKMIACQIEAEGLVFLKFFYNLNALFYVILFGSFTLLALWLSMTSSSCWISSALMEWITSEPRWTAANSSMISLIANGIHTTCSIARVAAFVVPTSSGMSTVNVIYTFSTLTGNKSVANIAR